MDELTVRIERAEGVDAAVGDRASGVLIERVKDRIGSTINVALVEPGTLERSAGKLKRVYDLR